MLEPRNVALALGGTVTGKTSVLVPGPGHSRSDRSLSIKIDPIAGDGFVVHSFAGDSPIECRDYVRAALHLGSPRGVGNHRLRGRARAAVPIDHCSDRSTFAQELWHGARDPRGTAVTKFRHKRPRHAVSAGAVSLRIPFLERYWFHPRNKPCADAL